MLERCSVSVAKSEQHSTNYMKINTFKNNLFILEANFVSEETRQRLLLMSEMFSKVGGINLIVSFLLRTGCEIGTRASGEIGRLVRFRFLCRKTCRFKSYLAYQLLRVVLKKLTCNGVLKLARVMMNLVGLKLKFFMILVLGSMCNHQHTCIYPRF